MKSTSRLLHLMLAPCLAASLSCATSQSDITTSGHHEARPVVVPVTQLDEDQFQLDFAPLPPDSLHEV